MSEGAERVWRIRVVIPFPKQIVGAEPPGEGELLPKKLGLQSRLPTDMQQIDGVRIAIGPSDHPLLPKQEGFADQWEAAELLLEVGGETAHGALERGRALLELVLDRLSFDMQTALHVVHTDVLDVTPPVAVGDQRELATFAGYPLDKFERSEDLGSVYVEPLPHLHASYPDPGRRGRAALRWYVKALGTPYLHDRFIFLWVGVEIFADGSGIEVREPLKARCGHHVIATCPECSEPTDRKMRGASIRKYLEARGAATDLAATAWRLRQMVHGDVPFDSEKLAELPATVQVLRSIVAAELKATLGLDAVDLPVVVSGVASIHPALGLGGTRVVEQRDLSWPT